MPSSVVKISDASYFKTRPLIERQKWIESLSDGEVAALNFDWEFWARPDQILPTHKAWITWLILAGRGYGKTRVGAETVREWVKKYRYVNLIGATLDDARDIMIEGESGIMACCPRDERPRYNSHKRRLEWPNGSRSLIFTADEPERMRGKQHMKLWCDELCAWRYIEAWHQASFGLRLGDNPQAVITTTPKPLKEISELMKDKSTVITRGSTFDNQANLAPAFISKIVSRYEGTRMGRQELYADLLDDMPGAMWRRSDIDAVRVRNAPEMTRIVISIDPAATANEGSDETGIVATAKGLDGRGYVLADESGIYTPDEWANKAIKLYKDLGADRVIGEVNNGGDMIEAILRNIDRNVSYKSVRATKGKAIRAEPVAALYEQHRVSHVGAFPILEDQMCMFTTDFDRNKSKYSPDRMDALVWGFTELMIEDAPGRNIIEHYQKQAQEQEIAARVVEQLKQAGKQPIASQCDFDSHYQRPR